MIENEIKSRRKTSGFKNDGGNLAEIKKLISIVSNSPLNLNKNSDSLWHGLVKVKHVSCHQYSNIPPFPSQQLA